MRTADASHVIGQNPVWPESEERAERLAADVLRAVPYGMNRFADLYLRYSIEHGEVQCWSAHLSWSPEHGESRTMDRSGATLIEALEQLLEALR